MSAAVLATSAIIASCATSTGPTPAPPPAEQLPEAVPSETTSSSPTAPVTGEAPDEPAVPAPQAPLPTTPQAAVKPSPWVTPPPEEIGYLQAVSWDELPGWHRDELGQAWPAFIRSCMALSSQARWQPPCLAAARMDRHDDASLRAFFESWFKPYRVLNADGSLTGLVTGYYEPLLRGSRTPSQKYRFPIYAVPDDLLTIEVDELFPELEGERVRGRRENGHVVPYYTRGEIEQGIDSLRGREILWVDDAVELFFLHIQGSGRVQLESGEIVRVGYANHNGHPYQSVGRILIDRGELTIADASMQGIKQWGHDNPDQLHELLAENPAYVFFRELPSDSSGPIGALGVAITPGRSIAVDEKSVPLGAPVYLSTSWPNSNRPLSRLMFAQDKGSAIKGAVRADFFWGFGEQAGELAGRMRQSGEMWVLLPGNIRTSANRPD
ncbi:MAG: MltA domain-containing protein [Betaproteobacteria bacterium]|nr:MAG: MltA domain-containing protein [Betaproteobacteria bacterium]